MENSGETVLDQVFEGEVRVENRALFKLLQSQGQAVSRRLDQVRKMAEPSLDQKAKLRQECRNLERNLEIETDGHRILEASLFIDKPFLEMAILQDDEHPEELFGLPAWKGWLEARVRSEHVYEMSLDEVSILHGLLTQGMDESIRGVYRKTSDLGGDYVTLGPKIFTEREIGAIEENPLLTIQYTDKEKKEGFIVYPDADDPENSSKILKHDKHLAGLKERGELTTEVMVKHLTKKALEKFGDYFHSPEAIAEFQRDIVSVHPFEDGNGRLSRLLMYWALKRGYGEPPILAHSEDDIFYTKTEWLDQIEMGQKYYNRLRGVWVADKNLSPESLILGLSKRAYHEILFKKDNPPPKKGSPLRHQAFQDYLESMKVGYGEFAGQAEYRVVLDRTHPRMEINSMGLVLPDYINTWGDTRPRNQEGHRRRYFFDKEVFRGGVCSDMSSPEDLLSFFQGATGISSGYRVGMLAGIAPTSISRVPVERVRDAMKFYNSVLLNDLKKVAGGSLKIPQGMADVFQAGLEEDDRIAGLTGGQSAAKGRDLDSSGYGKYLEYLLIKHVEAQKQQLWFSPFVSSSMSLRTARNFAGTSFDNVPRSTSVLVSSLLPRHGFVYTNAIRSTPITNKFPDPHLGEQEVLSIGAIDPNAVMTVEWFDWYMDKSPYAAAHRARDGSIVLVDFRDSRKMRFKFNTFGNLVKVSEGRMGYREMDSILKELKDNASRRSYDNSW